MIHVFIWLVVGGLLGWLASIVMGTDPEQNIQTDLAVGVGGAVIVGLIYADGSINRAVTLESVVWSFAGAIALLAIVNLVRKGRIR